MVVKKDVGVIVSSEHDGAKVMMPMYERFSIVRVFSIRWCL